MGRSGSASSRPPRRRSVRRILRPREIERLVLYFGELVGEIKPRRVHVARGRFQYFAVSPQEELGVPEAVLVQPVPRGPEVVSVDVSSAGIPAKLDVRDGRVKRTSVLPLALQYIADDRLHLGVEISD